MLKGIDDNKIIPRYPSAEEFKSETDDKRKERKEKLKSLGDNFKDFVRKAKEGGK